MSASSKSIAQPLCSQPQPGLFFPPLPNTSLQGWGAQLTPFAFHSSASKAKDNLESSAGLAIFVWMIEPWLVHFLDVSEKVFVIATHGLEDLARGRQELGRDNSDTQWRGKLRSTDVKEKQKTWSEGPSCCQALLGQSEDTALTRKEMGPKGRSALCRFQYQTEL